MTYTFHRSDATFSAISSTDLSDIGNIATSWTSYAPTVTAQSGSITATAIGRYQSIGKTLALSITATITATGTGSAGVLVTLPSGIVTSTGYTYLGGREMAVNGFALVAFASPSVGGSTQLFIHFYNDTSPISINSVLHISGILETK
jgi:hypothetical protein